MQELLNLADEDSMSLWNNLRLGYTETLGHPLLRQEISNLYPGRSLEDVLCFAGAEEGIYTAFRTLLSPSDHVVVVCPCYQSLRSIPEAICDVSTVNLDSKVGWNLQVNEIKNALKSNTKLLVMNFPHNPTGSIITKEQQNEIVALARVNDLWIFFDEVYRGIERDLEHTLPPISCLYEKGLSLGAMSKIYGMAGLRIGWIVCQNKALLQEISANKHYLSICNGGPSEILAILALRNSKAILSRVNYIIANNLQLFEEFLDRNPIFCWTAPKGACCGFVHLRSDTITLSSLAERLVNEYGVLILPGENFVKTEDANFESVSSHFRIGFGRENFPEALLRFELALAEILK